MLRPIALAGFVVLFPTIVQAQERATMPAVSHSMAAAPRVVARAPQPLVVRTPQPVVAQAMPGARIVVRTGTAQPRTAPTARIMRRPVSTPRIINADDTVFDSDFIPVPGLGFDIPHLAATRGPEAVGAGRHRRQFPFFFPFFNGGFFVPSTPVIVEEAPAPEAQQPEAREAEVPDAARRVRAFPSEPAPAPAVETPSPAPREADEFVFVRRDGTVFFAVAYAWENGVLRYITGEGLRRSVAKDALDLDATQQLNEQRGLNFRSPA